MNDHPRVMWSEGMQLAQHHFQAQNAYFERLAALALGELLPGARGLADCQLDDEALLNGTVVITAARGIMPDGLAFSFPEEEAPAPRNVAELFSPTQASHRVLLAVPEEIPGRANCQPAGHGAVTARYSAVERSVPDDVTGVEERAVQFARKNFTVLLDGEPSDGMVTLPIARIRRDGVGNFAYDAGFVAPCLRIGASRRLRELVANMVDMLESRADAVMAERAAGSADPTEYAPREIAAFWFLHALRSATPTLRHWRLTGDAHPERLFLHLAQLAGALCTFSLDASPTDLPAYDHDDAEAGFAALEAHIRRHLDVIMPTAAIALPVRPVAESYYAAAVQDRRCFQPDAHWFLGVRSGAPGGDLAARVMKLAKVCSAKFIDKLVQRAKPGLEMEHVPRPPAALTPRIGMQYFRLGRTEPCWSWIEEAGEVGLYLPAAIAQPELELKVVLERPRER